MRSATRMRDRVPPLRTAIASAATASTPIVAVTKRLLPRNLDRRDAAVAGASRGAAAVTEASTGWFGLTRGIVFASRGSKALGSRELADPGLSGGQVACAPASTNARRNAFAF